MQRMTIKEWAEKVETNATGMQAEHYRIYVIRDGETVFYVGQSHNPHNRLLEHMTLSWTEPSLIGTFIRENAPTTG